MEDRGRTVETVVDPARGDRRARDRRRGSSGCRSTDARRPVSPDADARPPHPRRRGAARSRPLPAGCAGSTPPTAHGPPPEPSAPSSPTSNDGDTLRSTTGARCGSLQIDAPELHGDCYGKAARVALRRLAPNGTPDHARARPRTRRDRSLRAPAPLRRSSAARTSTSRSCAQGAASPYFFRGERGRYARDLLAAVAEARAARRGYWGACPGARLDTGVGSITGPADSPAPRRAVAIG